ncbi:hypothetical protein [Bifidobacterium felsineum]|uniref:hypothetical protein n=1 Tax=Bifidobacterium felsineum TaxID=2045440 RepID=UPI001BDBB6A7|nr:hypothetical protein [Bifidobacterium felsineum]MBT1164648.1 hypothetical protein [Bifidobacterium felsineum]
MNGIEPGETPVRLADGSLMLAPFLTVQHENGVWTFHALLDGLDEATLDLTDGEARMFARIVMESDRGE